MARGKSSTGKGKGGDGPKIPMVPAREGVKREFGRRLAKLMLDKGWNNSEMARQATRHAGTPVGRDLIGNYVNGKSLPRPIQLQAIASALKVEPRDLLPDTDFAARYESAYPEAEIKNIPNTDTATVRINQIVSKKKASKIYSILEEDD